MKVGYIRVSTKEQNTARQDVLMQQLGVEKLYADKLSGKDTARPQLEAMLEFVRENDCLIVESFSRLARSTRDLLNIVDTLNKKGVAFESQKEKIDTTTPTGKFFLTVIAALSELERATLLERQREGIECAKTAGKYQGRVPIKTDWSLFERLYKRWKEGEITAVKMRRELGFTAQTFYRRVREFESKQSA